MPYKFNAVTGELDLVLRPGDGIAVTSVATDSGSATATDAGVISLVGGTGVTTSGSGSTATITAGATVAIDFVTDSGTATPAANSLNVVGSGSIDTTGSGDTLTINLSSEGGTSTDNAIVRWSGTGGNTIQNSSVTIDDSDVVSGITQLNVDNLRIDGNTISSTDVNGNIQLVPNGSGLVTASELALTTDLAVTYGGTGRGSSTAYAVICGGTSSTNPHQSVSGVGSSGEVLTSNGGSALPTWQAIPAATDVSDATFRIQDDGDNTKEIAFQASGITTGTVRTITMADADVDLTANTGTYAAAAGGTQIVTLGTIATGTWEGTTIAVDQGGTGQTSYTNGQLLIGRTSDNSLVKATLSDGDGINITNGAGSITIAGVNATTAVKGVASFNSADFSVAAAAVSLGDDVVKDIGTDSGAVTPSTHTFNIVGAGSVSTSGSGDTVTITGSAATDVQDDTFRIQDNGDNTKQIAFEASGITTATTRTITMADQAVDLTPNTGTYPASVGGTQITTLGTIATGTWEGTTIAVDQGGTGQTSYTNGQLLIGNTTGNTLTKATLSEGEGIDITNGTGSITIAGETATTTNSGIAELATDAETVTGTDTGRTVTPSGVRAALDAPGDIGSTTAATSIAVDSLTLDGDQIVSTGDLDVKLGDAAGANTFNVLDSANDVPLSVSSNGKVIVNAPVSGDPEIEFQINEVDNFSIRVDDSDSDQFKISHPTSGTALRIDSDGYLGFLQMPAFRAEVNSTLSNVTGNTTTYTIVYQNEDYDDGSWFNTGTGTGTTLIAGKYSLTGGIRLDGVTSSATIFDYQIRINGAGSTGAQFRVNAGNIRTSNSIRLSITTELELAASDTITATINVSGEGSDVNDVTSSQLNFLTARLISTT